MNTYIYIYIPIYPYIYISYRPSRCRFRSEIIKNHQKYDFSELSLPGGEIVPTPCASILRTTRASHLPYNAKSEKLLKLCILLVFLYNFPIYPYISLGTYNVSIIRMSLLDQYQCCRAACTPSEALWACLEHYIG